ncbi:hypothetical protein J6590_037375, partial [Homalodisca vitripennis]
TTADQLSVLFCTWLEISWLAWQEANGACASTPTPSRLFNNIDPQQTSAELQPRRSYFHG